MSDLIPVPVLDNRSGEEFAAEMIGRVTGGLSVTRIDIQIAVLRALRDLVDGGSLSPPICPELTNANPSSPHTVILETLGWSMEQQAYLINQLPRRDQIAFANIFGIGLREATKAATTLRFTTDGQHDVTVPAGAQVSTEDGTVVFATTAEIVIPADPDALTGDVAAQSTVAGAVLLADSTLTKLSDAIAFVVGVANPDPVDSGAEAETVESALQRARNFQRRGMRLVSERDVEDFIFEEVLRGVGIVKAFPFIREGDFSVRHAGHTSIVVMTANGHGITDEIEEAINSGLSQAIGSQFFYLLTPHDVAGQDDPLFVTFNVTASIKVESIAPQDAIKASVERNLRAFYAVKKGNFGRTILRSEIISIIEGTPGVDRIVSDPDGPIVETPGADMNVAVYQLPKLVSVALTVVP